MASPTFVAVSKFKLANEMAKDVREAFVNRPHLVDGADGFVRMDVMSPTGDESEFWLVTYWTNEASFEAWHRSHLYRDSHAGIPHGLKLVPEATQIMTFRYVSN